MKNACYSLLLFIMVTLPIQAKSDGDVLVAKSMLKRLIPAYVDQFQFKKTDSEKDLLG